MSIGFDATNTALWIATGLGLLCILAGLAIRQVTLWVHRLLDSAEPDIEPPDDNVEDQPPVGWHRP
jgi:hypothetical protein